MLKRFLSSLDGLSDPEKAHYKERSGIKDDDQNKYELETEGFADPAKIAEFRENNVKLNRQLEEEKKRWEGVGDPEDVKALLKKRKEIEEGEVIKKEGVEKVIETRTAAMAQGHAKVLREKEERLATMTRELTQAKIDHAVTAEATRLGALPESLDVITLLARSTWTIDENGNAVAKGPDGKQVYSAHDGNPIKMEEWTETLVKTKPMLFKESKGSGSGGSDNGAGGGGDADNPWKPGSLSKTKQQAIMGTDRAKALRLMSAAGVKPPAGY